MSAQEQQEEEREVLLSIYEGDDHFIDLAPNQYQYKVGEDGASKSILVEIKWGDNYPDELPSINLDLFYNKHIVDNVKSSMKKVLLEEAEQLLGCGSTYTLFEYAKENKDTLLESQPEIIITQEETVEEAPTQPDPTGKQSKQKKENLSKNQKRRLYDKFGTQGMMEGKHRGWNWVDVLKHLSQTGSKADDE